VQTNTTRTSDSYNSISSGLAYQAKPLPSDTKTDPILYINSFEELVELFRQNKEALIYNWLISEVSLISFKPGKLEISLTAQIPKDFPQRVTKHLRQWTGVNWVVAASNQSGAPSLLKQQQNKALNLKTELEKHPNIYKILEIFPGAYISKIDNNEI
jgi:DNA polymerase-3 subunit gamma/tau